eukprot:6208591-Pleurochrysis_carterae.AAC.2
MNTYQVSYLHNRHNEIADHAILDYEPYMCSKKNRASCQVGGAGGKVMQTLRSSHGWPSNDRAGVSKRPCFVGIHLYYASAELLICPEQPSGLANGQNKAYL